MIFVFLIILIVALIVANLLIKVSKPRKQERGFANPSSDFAEDPEVIEKVENIHENTALIQGSLQATNRKIEMINDRLSTLEKVVMTVVEGKISSQNKNNSEED